MRLQSCVLLGSGLTLALNLPVALSSFVQWLKIPNHGSGVRIK